MTSVSADRFQFASDFDGDLHLFPKNLNEPDYQDRWEVWVILADGSRKKAPLFTPPMCVNDGSSGGIEHQSPGRGVPHASQRQLSACPKKLIDRRPDRRVGPPLVLVHNET